MGLFDRELETECEIEAGQVARRQERFRFDGAFGIQCGGNHYKSMEKGMNIEPSKVIGQAEIPEHELSAAIEESADKMIELLTSYGVPLGYGKENPCVVEVESVIKEGVKTLRYRWIPKHA